MRKCVSALTYAAALASIAVPASSAEYMEKSQQMAMRAYSPGVITDGGRIVWLAGQTGFRDEQGKEVAGFDAQARQAFRGIDAVLKKAGGSLANMVTMTVFINDPRNGDRFVARRSGPQAGPLNRPDWRRAHGTLWPSRVIGTPPGIIALIR